MNNSSNKSQKKMEHQKHSSEYIDSLIDNVYWNWKYIGDDNTSPNDPYIDLNLKTVQVWVVITLNNGYKLGTNSECCKFYMYEVIEQCYNTLKTHLMYSLDYISYILLHKDMSFIKNKDLNRLKLAKSLYELSLKEGRLIH